MKRSGVLVILIMVTFHFSVSEGSESCNRTCHSRTVPYPFGFGHGCQNMLQCSSDGNITLYGYKVANVTTDGVLLHDEGQCNQSLLAVDVFGDKYALTSRNIVLVKNCSKADFSCALNVTKIGDTYASHGCNFSNSTCLSPSGDFIPWNIKKIGCNMVLTGIVVDSIAGLELKLDLGKFQLGWWIEGDCSNKCSTNGNCTQFVSPNTGNPVHKCSCNDGFVGDGYLQGDGCRKEKCNPLTEHCGGATGVAVLVGGLIAGATLVVVIVLLYCFFKKKALANQRRRTRKKLLSANGGSFRIPIFTYKELEKATKGFSEEERLGNGAFGTVYAGKLKGDCPVAVKKIRHIDTHGIEQMMNEIKLLSSVEHPNLVRLMGCCLENGEPILVYEYMPNGTLAQHLQRERGEGLSWAQRIRLASETADALAYLHSAINPPIYHRDVKSSNILLDYSFNSKVADFGLSRIVLTELSHISTVPQGTPGYLDPQYHQNFHLSDKSDVYSFGVVLVEIITAMKVVDFSRSKSEINLASLAIARIGSGCVDEIIDPFLEPEKDSWVRATVHRVAELAFRCLAFDRDARPSMLEVTEELEFIKDTIQTRNPNIRNDAILTDDDYGNISKRQSTDSAKQSIRKSSSSSRRITIQPPVITELKTAAILQNTETASPVSVQDPWLSGQSSPSTSCLLENVIE